MVNSKAWPFIEAQKILDKIGNKTPKKGYVLFESGYGPSGLPHIGTFGEVARTTMVINAFKQLSDIPTKLIAFSDDMDGLRKVPDNLPNKEMLKNHIGLPLTSIPDPFGKFGSFAEYMNNKLCEFLDQFNFDYEFKSATKSYKSGEFDQALLVALKHHQDILDIMLPSLGAERQASYSPFLPICPKTGKVLQVPILKCDVDQGTITYQDELTSELITIPVTKGNCKMQWKADWALRWFALEVDYEMHGKDLIPSEILSAQICRAMGGVPPITFNYELFLDEKGQKISKSKGNGITIDEWLKYATTESLALYMYQAPKKAKRLYFDVIPKNVDEYIIFGSKYDENSEEKYDNPLWHIHSGNVPKHKMFGLNFALLLNLASACNADDKEILWGFIKKYAADASPNTAPFLDHLAGFAVTYYNDFIKPNKKYRDPNEQEVKILQKIKIYLESLKGNISAEDIQNNIYKIGEELAPDDLKNYFKSLYEILLGETQGPRLGSFIVVYGISETINLINQKIIHREG